MVEAAERRKTKMANPNAKVLHSRFASWVK